VIDLPAMLHGGLLEPAVTVPKGVSTRFRGDLASWMNMSPAGCLPIRWVLRPA
jgi:hypothetical protein